MKRCNHWLQPSYALRQKRLVRFMVISGVYKLTCKPNGLIYVGSSSNIIRRWDELSTYNTMYRAYIATNHRLDMALRQFGVDAFRFEILELVLPEHLATRELYWILHTNCTDPLIGFNANKSATRSRGSGNAKYHQVYTRAMQRFGAIALTEVARLTQSK